MAQRSYEVRPIDGSKKHGLFATQKISQGTKILVEYATMLNAQPLANIVRYWKKINTQDVSLHKTTATDLEFQTQQIVHGMQDLRDAIKDNQKYVEVMQLHDERMEEMTTNSSNSGDVTLTGGNPRLTMDLYKRTINSNVPHSDDVVTAVLQKSLQQINTYLLGTVTVTHPNNHAWGPHTSFINHGCNPKALVSSFSRPDPESTTLRNVGQIAVHALIDIEVGEEITIEKMPAVGTLKDRRLQLRRIGIARCECDLCEYEEGLSQQPEDVAAKTQLQKLTVEEEKFQKFFAEDYPTFIDMKPAAFYQSVYTMIASLHDYGYRGSMTPRLYEAAIKYAERFNDNIRLLWFALQLCWYLGVAYGTEHARYTRCFEIYQSALQGTIWNEENKDLLTLCETEFEDPNANADLIFMLDQPSSSPDYHLLGFHPNGHLIPVTVEDNLTRVRQTLALRQLQHATQQEEKQEVEEGDVDVEKEREAAAERAAEELAAEEEMEQAKKEKEKRKKKEKAKRQKERKRAAKEEEEAKVAAAAAATEARLAAAVAAVRAAVVVPALPRARPATPAPAPAPVRVPSPPPLPPPPTPPPHHRHFRSSSGPEPVTVARFLAGVPLRLPPSVFRDEDSVSESGLEIRFGVKVWEEEKQRKWEFVGWYVGRRGTR